MVAGNCLSSDPLVMVNVSHNSLYHEGLSGPFVIDHL